MLTVEVNRDFSGDGVYDAGEDPGQPGVTVAITDGVTSETVMTDASGRAVFDLSGFTESRFRVNVEVTDPDLGHLQLAPAATWGTPNAFRSATTFVDGTTQTIHVGVWNPDTYSPENPLVAVSQQVDRAAAGATRSIMLTEWNNRGPFDMSAANNTTGIDQIATQAETGAVFSLAWDYRRDALFSGAYAKAHTLYGPGGAGGIYRTDTAAAGTSGNTVLWATVPDAGDSVHQTTTGRDDAFFTANGTEGIGGLALSEDGETLYAVNLNDKRVYSYDADAAAPATPLGSVAIADPGCVGGDWRPFALTFRDGDLYAGGVCDASDSLARADLAVHILKLDGATFTGVFTHGLDHRRGGQNYADPAGNLTGPQVSTHWNPWRDTYDADIAAAFNTIPLYPMPLLTTFTFENDGSIVLGFRDRKPDAVVSNGFGADGISPTIGHVAGGDLNKVCLTAGVYEWEGTGACPNNHTASNAGAEPADRVEFFPGDFMLGATRYGPTTVHHDENALGAVLISPREEDVLGTTMNATQLYNTNGIGWYDRTTGEGPGNDWENRALLVAGNTAVNFGKGNGLGAVSLLAAQAPIQIGSYVWFDADHDGEQGPAGSEPPVPGATVRLLSADGTTVLAETITDEKGEYYFGGEGGYPLEPDVDYIVEFDLTGIDPATLPGSPTADQLEYTLVRVDAIDDRHDSNPSPTGNPLIGRATVTTPPPGGVDHAIDAGIWADNPVPDIDIVKFDGRATALVDPVDGPDPVDGAYGGATEGGWPAEVDADTEDHAVGYDLDGATTGPQPVTFIITNTGNVQIVDVTVADLTVQGPALTDVSCDFSPLGGPASGLEWAGPFVPRDEFECSGLVELTEGDVHHDIASVTGQPVDPGGEPLGERIGDEDPYWAVAPPAAEPPAPSAPSAGLASTGGGHVLTLSALAVLLLILGSGVLLSVRRRAQNG